MTTILVLLVVVAFVLVIGVVQAGSNAVLETVTDVLFRSMPDRKRRTTTFVTSLSVSEALAAAGEAATGLDGTPIKHGADDLGLIVKFQSGGSVRLTASIASPTEVRLRVAPGNPPSDDGTLARFRGALLASLRKRDVTVRQK
jgi:hypothetical protein